MTPDHNGAAMKAVSSYNEWDPLEEIIVGILDGSSVMPWDIGFGAMIPADYREGVRKYHAMFAGQPLPRAQREVAQRELDQFVHILEAEGVTVRRPDPIDHARPFATPAWQSKGGNAQANPRDVLLVVGDEIIEAPMGWRARYFEFHAYRRLVKEYFRAGARWTAAPKAIMADDLYNPAYQRGSEYVTTEVEPVFDAADAARLGKDIVVQRSQVTNRFGIEWLRRHLEGRFTVHEVEFHDDRAVHIDATFVPLAPGKVLVNPARPIKQMPEIFRRGGWEFLPAPPTTLPRSHPSFQSYEWLHMNMLSLDEKRIIVEASEQPLIDSLRGWGFQPIPCHFRNNYRYGGSFHCATCDVRRRGELLSYF